MPDPSTYLHSPAFYERQHKSNYENKTAQITPAQITLAQITPTQRPELVNEETTNLSEDSVGCLVIYVTWITV